MRVRTQNASRAAKGYALATVMVFGGISFLILVGAISWTSANANLVDRNNQYFVSVAAAEAATEKVVAEISMDFQKQGPVWVSSKTLTYRTRIPQPSENGLWSNYRFSNGRGRDDETRVELITPWGISPLLSQYEGLLGYAATYQIVSNARELDARSDIIGAVQQDVQLATIPIFQFAIFYNMHLEINPGPNMTVKGRVHSNGHIYSQPGATLEFKGDVTAVHDINHFRMPGDPTSPGGGTIIYRGQHDGGKSSLNLPISTDNSPDSVRQIVDIPPSGESASSALGQQRFYNKADLVILVGDTGVEARNGALAPVSGAVTLNWTGAGGISSFVRTNVSFYNKREGKMVKTTEIDVAQLGAWNTTGNPLKTALGRDVNSIYIVDQRSQTGGTEPGVRLVNGQTLPSKGLTVATPDPLYVKGHYNARGSALGTSDTSNTRPAALIGDSINILSGNWNDANSGLGYSSRNATPTTVNAAFLAGIVPTGNGNYSGGVENFPRFLENWDGMNFTYNGSMIVMFPSKFSIAPWKAPGSSFGVYGAPVRNWNFDVNFLDPNRLPPGTPAVRTMIRGKWTNTAPNT